MHKETKIAVVGGGASGLSAAYLLGKAGYRHVTVFEKDNRVGGKCRTIWIEGRSYELGGLLHLSGTEPVAGLIRELGVKTISGTVIPGERSGPSPLFDLRLLEHVRYPRIIQTCVAAVRFTLKALVNSNICGPGHENMPVDLAVPLSTWLQSSGLGPLELLFACWMSGFGYGYTDRIPAAYALKFCTPRMVWKTLFGALRGFTNGYQDLWNRVAARLDVRLEHPVSSIRRGEKVTLRAGDREFEFDKLILCCDLRAIAPALDLDAEESELIGRIADHRYHTVIAETEGMPSRVAFVPAHFSDRFAGAIVSWYHRWSENNLFNFYAIAPNDVSNEDVHRRIREDVRGLGGNLVRIVSSENWSYFPQVSCEDLKAGFYRRLEGRQGCRNTFYAGEIMHFPSVDLLAAYSAHLVRRHFA